MYEKDMVNALEGNVSVKDGSKIYITPSGICKGSLEEDMLVIVDELGNIIEGDYKPTSEMKLHLECYRLRSDITCVIHNHSTYATAFAIANKPIESKAYPEMMVIFDKIPVVAYGTPSTDEVHEDVKNHIDKTDVFLLSRHGVVAVGKELNDAFYKIEAVESIAKKLTIVKSLGGEAPLSKEQIEKLYEMRNKD
jgi:L-fuculose-phosphate aldolase